MIIRSVNKYLALVMWLAYLIPLYFILELKVENLSDLPEKIFVLTVIVGAGLFPHAITHVMILRYKNIASQYLLFIAFVLYGVWILILVVDSKANPDPQGAIIFVFAGVYSLPVMGFLWLKAKDYYYKSSDNYDKTKT
jgi:hypothetical protein